MELPKRRGHHETESFVQNWWSCLLTLLASEPRRLQWAHLFQVEAWSSIRVSAQPPSCCIASPGGCFRVFDVSTGTKSCKSVFCPSYFLFSHKWNLDVFLFPQFKPCEGKPSIIRCDTEAGCLPSPPSLSPAVVTLCAFSVDAPARQGTCRKMSILFCRRGD